MHTFILEQRNKAEKVFDDIYIPFEFRFETVSLTLHGHNNSFNGVHCISKELPQTVA